MTMFVRTVAGDMVNIAFAETLTIEIAGDTNYEVVASPGGHVIFRDRSRRKVEQMLTSLAARANGNGTSPIDVAETPVGLRRGLRFGDARVAKR